MQMKTEEKAKIWGKGQITIPSRWREEFDLDEGEIVYIQKVGDGLLLRPQQSTIALIQKKGEQLLAKKGISLQELITDNED